MGKKRKNKESLDLRNIFLHPLKGFPLIFEAIVEARSLLDFSASEEAIRPNTIVEINNDNVATRGFDQSTAIVVWIGIGVKATTLNEEVHRKFGVGGGTSWCIDIEKQALLRRCRIRCISVSWSGQTYEAVL